MNFKLLFVFLLSLLLCAQAFKMKVTKSKNTKSAGCKAGCTLLGVLSNECYSACMDA